MCEEENSTPTRSLRQRTANPVVAARPQRRRSLNFKLEETNVEDIYRQVNAKTDFNPTPLETIYESPKGKCQGLRDVMGGIKLKRHFRFQPFYNPSKIKMKQRKTKSKKIKRVGANNNKSYVVTLEQVEKALKYISEDENEENCQPTKVQKLANYELMRKEETVKGNESVESAIVEIAPMVIDLKDEVVDTSNVPENQNGFLDFESVCDFPSPGKVKVDKSKRNKRRSGRIPPLCLSNIFNDSSLEHVDKKLCIDNNVNGISDDHCPMQVDKSTTNIDHQLSQNSLPSTSSSFKSAEITPVNKKPKRRNSGINKSIYRNNYVISSPNSNDIVEEEENANCELEDFVNKRLLSPTSLLDQLSLGSPEPVQISNTKRARRKSARLSFGGDRKPNFGSLWVDPRSPKKENLLDSFSTTPLTTTDNFDSAKYSTKEVNAENMPIKLDSKRLDEVKMEGLDFNDSPILTGIIDCQARLHQDKKFKVRKGSKINLDHFVTTK